MKPDWFSSTAVCRCLNSNSKSLDRCGDLWRVDFAWPDAMLVAEYDSVEWHANPTAFKHDRIKTARLQECGYTVLPIVVDDIRRNPLDLVARINGQLDGASLAG